MSPKAATILNCAIGMTLMSYAWFVIHKKSVQNPGMKIFGGLSMKTIKIIFLVGLLSCLLWIIVELTVSQEPVMKEIPQNEIKH